MSHMVESVQTRCFEGRSRPIGDSPVPMKNRGEGRSSRLTTSSPKESDCLLVDTFKIFCPHLWGY